MYFDWNFNHNSLYSKVSLHEECDDSELSKRDTSMSVP